MVAPIKGGEVGPKRLLFRRGDVVLVIDFGVFESTTRQLLKEQGAERLPDEASLLRRFGQALDKHDEVQAERFVLGKHEQERLDRRLAEVLDQGAFVIRQAKPASGRPARDRPGADTIFRLDYSYNCGDRCGTSGRVFVTRSCQELVAVTDWVS